MVVGRLAACLISQRGTSQSGKDRVQASVSPTSIHLCGPGASLLVLAITPLPLITTAPLCSLSCRLLALGFVLSAKAARAAVIREGISRAPKPRAHAQNENEKNHVGNRPGVHGHLADGAMVNQPVKK